MSSKTKEEEEFAILRKHILSCPKVSNDSKAVHAALQGLETELKRMERDTKLKRKFIAGKTATTEKGTVTMENEQLSKPSTKLAQQINCNTDDNDNDETMMEEWQDVATNSTGSLGNHLAQLAVTAMAKHQTEVKTPLGAIALALHASLITETLGFACTGIPETETPKGFAPPIRELPKTQLVPEKWEDSGNKIELRYRKQGVGTVVLSVTREELEETKVTLSRSSSNESSEPLLFPLEDHVNLESFQKAFRKSSSVLPALHYKALPLLLTNFCNQFDLGSIREEGSSFVPPERLPYYDSTVIPQVPPPANPLRIGAIRTPGDSTYVNPHDTPTIQVFQQPYPNNRGDFSGDLVPPGNGNFMGDRGNLMGPNHPLFAGRGNPGVIPSGGFGMRPRFDPYGPPGGPQDDDPNNLLHHPDGGRRLRPPPGGFGNPNNDHARPPNDLGNNMFM